MQLLNFQSFADALHFLRQIIRLERQITIRLYVICKERKCYQRYIHQRLQIFDDIGYDSCIDSNVYIYIYISSI